MERTPTSQGLPSCMTMAGPPESPLQLLACAPPSCGMSCVYVCAPSRTRAGAAQESSARLQASEASGRGEEGGNERWQREMAR